MLSYANSRLGALSLTVVLLAACSSGNPLDNEVPAPIESRTTPLAVNHDPDWRPQTITVSKGDTLYSLALEYGHDYKDLAAWNHLSDPNVINVGQQLRLTPPDATAVVGPVAPVAVAAPPKIVAATPPVPELMLSQPKALMVPYSDSALATLKAALQAPVVVAKTVTKTPTSSNSTAAVNVNNLSSVDSRLPTKGLPTPDLKTENKPLPVAVASAAQAQTKVAVVEPVKPESKDESPKDGDDEAVSWQWPTQGKVVMGFREGASKGIDIAGKKGQAIFSASVGKVVYSGNGLRGYGKLVIIKANKTYLSAYAHNQTVLVKEGDTVVKGQKIAEMGDTDSDKVELHFEIRRYGKPVDPIKYLPAETS